MPYPSFIWSEPLGEGGEREGKTPESTLADLLSDKELRERSLPLLRIPCRAEEIRGRQELFFAMLYDGGFAERIAALERRLADTEELWGEMQRAESEEEKTFFFIPLLCRFFDDAEALAELSGARGHAGRIGAFWQEFVENPDNRMAEKRCRDLLERHDDALKITVRGSHVEVWERRESLRGKLTVMMRDMGLEDAIPPVRQPARVSAELAKAVSSVYYTYYQAAAAFRADYEKSFLAGEKNIAAVFGYLPELRFLLDLTAYFVRLKENGYPLCFPEVTDRREFRLTDAVDPSLLKRGVKGGDVVPNDLDMRDGEERLTFYILSGANGGGKTTFLRACSLAALFFSVGCPVAAKSGRCKPLDAAYTHFPPDESFENSGRFADESVRADEILEGATENSFAVFNETYSGTDEKKSEEYSARLADAMFERGTFGIYVTHIHSLTGGRIPTLAALIDEEDGNRRTYRIRRVGGTSSSFARDILEKYGLDRDSLEARLNAGKGGV